MAADLTKAELCDAVQREVGWTRHEVRLFVDAFFAVIRERLEGGEIVKLSGFGVFSLRDKGRRPGRNPRTGEVVPIEPRRVVTFHASRKLREAVAEASSVKSSAGVAVEVP
ncbi:MAG: integration host factor subunit alpha [Hydrogenophilus sp.]|nr:integration host factor subunit alpha [Hydrogenophilus sp.]